jgi:malate dehydrogenase (oxaloacetate-decarboxylating)
VLSVRGNDRGQDYAKCVVRMSHPLLTMDFGGDDFATRSFKLNVHETKGVEMPSVNTPLEDALHNRGVAFTEEQRSRLGLIGKLPSGVLTLDEQAGRAYRQLEEQPNDLAKNVYLEQLHDRNETLYFKLLSDHLAELLPIVYDPTVGEAIEQYSDEYRQPRGVYLSIDRPEEIEQSFVSLGLGADDVDVIVCSDAEEILGIGDWGVGGVQIAVGKLAIYTAGAGIDPGRVIPVSLDVGTDNESLLNDPYYLGNRHARRRGDDYDAFIKKYVETTSKLFPHALLHFEDFGPEHARKILQTYRGDYRVFNDDVQGTGAVVMAAIYAANRVTGVPMKSQRMVVFGAGSAGVGIADQLHDAIVAAGATDEEARSQIWLVDKQGLLFDDMPNLRDFQTTYAKERSDAPWAPASGPVGLVDTIAGVEPTILLGTSTAHGAFTKEVIETMCKVAERPLILPISNPTSRIEVMPSDVISWSEGKALLAVGIPVEPVTYKGTTFTIGQANNFLVFPGLGLGVIVAKASRVTPNMLIAAAIAVANQVDVAQPGTPLLPKVENLRAASALVAEAVVRAAVADGVAECNPSDLTQAVHDAMWQPVYPEVG